MKKKKKVKEIIEKAWEDRSLLENIETVQVVRDVIKKLDNGEIRIAKKVDSNWVVNEWIKKAVVLYFPIQKMKTLEAGPMEFHDKIPLKKNF